MNKIHFAGWLLLCLIVSCKRNDGLSGLKAVSKSFTNGNEMILSHSGDILSKLEEDCRIPYAVNKARPWRSVALVVRDRSLQTVAYIEELKIVLRASKDDRGRRLHDLYDSLLSYAGDVANALSAPTQTGSTYKKQLANDAAILKKKMMCRFGITADGSGDSLLLAVDWSRKYFSRTSSALTVLFLDKLHSDVLMTCDALITYCATAYSYHRINFYPHFRPIAKLSSSYVKPGDSVQVWAGLAEFSYYGLRYVSIDGKPVKTDQYDVAEYKLQAAKTPGKHTVKVRIDVVNDYGDSVFIDRKINYTVLP